MQLFQMAHMHKLIDYFYVVIASTISSPVKSYWWVLLYPYFFFTIANPSQAGQQKVFKPTNRVWSPKRPPVPVKANGSTASGLWSPFWLHKQARGTSVKSLLALQRNPWWRLLLREFFFCGHQQHYLAKLQLKWFSWFEQKRQGFYIQQITLYNPSLCLTECFHYWFLLMYLCICVWLNVFIIACVTVFLKLKLACKCFKCVQVCLWQVCASVQVCLWLDECPSLCDWSTLSQTLCHTLVFVFIFAFVFVFVALKLTQFSHISNFAMAVVLVHWVLLIAISIDIYCWNIWVSHFLIENNTGDTRTCPAFSSSAFFRD